MRIPACLASFAIATALYLLFGLSVRVIFLHLNQSFEALPDFTPWTSTVSSLLSVFHHHVSLGVWVVLLPYGFPSFVKLFVVGIMPLLSHPSAFLNLQFIGILFHRSSAANYLDFWLQSKFKGYTTWWNGVGKCLDVTNPAATAWFKGRLQVCKLAIIIMLQWCDNLEFW